MSITSVLLADATAENAWHRKNELSPGSSALTVMPDRFRAKGRKPETLRQTVVRQDRFLATMDRELQHRPDQVLLMFHTLATADLVVDNKRDGKDSLQKRLQSRVFNRIPTGMTELCYRQGLSNETPTRQGLACFTALRWGAAQSGRDCAEGGIPCFTATERAPLDTSRTIQIWL